MTSTSVYTNGTHRPARDGGKMWSEADTVRFLQEWHRLNLTLPDSSRTEKTALIRPLFMNRSDRSVTSKIDLELKRLRGEQSDPYPQLNSLREKVYGIKAKECMDREKHAVDEEAEESEGEATAFVPPNPKHSSSFSSFSSDNGNKERKRECNDDDDDDDDEEEEEEEEIDDDDNDNNKNNKRAHENVRQNTEPSRPNKRLKRKSKRKMAKLKKAAKEVERASRSKVIRLWKIGTSIADEPNALWLGPKVYNELQKVELLFKQLKDEQGLLVEYSRSVAAELKLVKSLFDENNNDLQNQKTLLHH